MLGGAWFAVDAIAERSALGELLAEARRTWRADGPTAAARVLRPSAARFGGYAEFDDVLRQAVVASIAPRTESILASMAFSIPALDLVGSEELARLRADAESDLDRVEDPSGLEQQLVLLDYFEGRPDQALARIERLERAGVAGSRLDDLTWLMRGDDASADDWAAFLDAHVDREPLGEADRSVRALVLLVGVEVLADAGREPAIRDRALVRALQTIQPLASQGEHKLALAILGKLQLLAGDAPAAAASFERLRDLCDDDEEQAATFHLLRAEVATIEPGLAWDFAPGAAPAFDRQVAELDVLLRKLLDLGAIRVAPLVDVLGNALNLEFQTALDAGASAVVLRRGVAWLRVIEPYHERLVGPGSSLRATALLVARAMQSEGCAARIWREYAEFLTPQRLPDDFGPVLDYVRASWIDPAFREFVASVDDGIGWYDEDRCERIRSALSREQRLAPHRRYAAMELALQACTELHARQRDGGGHGDPDRAAALREAFPAAERPTELDELLKVLDG